MTNLSINQQIETILQTLSLPVAAEDAAVVWSVQSKEAAYKYFVNLRTSMDSGQPLHLGIVRGLDHWGVVGGELLESIAKVTNSLRSNDNHREYTR